MKNKEQCPLQLKACRECDDFIMTINGGRVIYKTLGCKHQQVRNLMIKKSGMFGKDVHERFDVAKMDKHNYKLYQYLQNEWDRRKWLYLFSYENGTGKSFTANAIANMLIDKGIQPLVIREIDIATKIQATFGDYTGAIEADVSMKYKAVPVLIIQDFGKQNCRSEWWPQKIFDIIDYRGIQQRTTIFTSNLDLTNKNLLINKFGDNHGAAIQSRLLGECEIWELGGPDRRIRFDC